MTTPLHTIIANGRTLTAELDGTALVIFVDGQRLGPFERLIRPETRDGIIITHRAGSLSIRQAYGAAIETAWQAHPLGRAATLRGERAALARRLETLHDEEYTLRSREIARGGRMTVIDMTAPIAAAQAALDAFDVAHPDVVAALRAEREARRLENIQAAENA